MPYLETIPSSDQRGVALLLALLIMAGLVAAGVTLGNVMLREIQQSRQFDNAIEAYYGAESGAEHAVFDWRNANGTAALDTTCTEANSVGFTCQAAEEDVYEVDFSLSQLASEQIPLYNPDDLSQPAGIESAQIYWHTSATSGQDPWLEVTLLGWTAGQSVDFSDLNNPDKVETRIFKCMNDGSGNCVPAVIDSFVATKSYIVKIRPLYNDIDQVRAYFYADNNKTVAKNLKDYIKVLNVTGSYRGVEQAVKVRFPAAAPESPMFDFVLFSEDSLLKNIN